jgi:transcriptional regulator of acetoin/glycerol metabolism
MPMTLKNKFSIDQLKKEIRESHNRSAAMGINLTERNPDQNRLSHAGLEKRKETYKDLLDVGCEYISEFYDLISPDQFLVAIVDNEGYILHTAGSDQIKNDFRKRNYAPGYRFSEKDVGTTATSLCLKKKIPVQLNDKEHYCLRAHGYTSSAAPIFGKNDQLNGVLVVSGKSQLVHPHTLIMIASAAHSIEKQIRLIRRNRDLLLYSGFLNNVLDSVETGLLILDSASRIWITNPKAQMILKQKNLNGKPLSILNGFKIDMDDLEKHPKAWKEKEFSIRHPQGLIHLLCSAQIVFSEKKQRLGAVIFFEEVQTIKKISAKLSSEKPFFTFDHLVGKTTVFRSALELAKRAAISNSTVLLMGETGTGKELFAQAIHNADSRGSIPFIPINCGAIPAELMESELFGYVDGAFSGALKGGRPGKFELADNGTLLLDEIGDMPYNMQVKLLRVLQTGEIQRVGSSKLETVNVRIIASTNVNLLEAIEQKKFRQDLYYRLNILPITIPSLRDRGEKDIQLLANHFIPKHDPSYRLSIDANLMLTKYTWPGNVRELENTIQMAINLCDGDTIRPEHLNLKESKIIKPLTGKLKTMEQDMISLILKNNQFNMAQTAKDLGISRATLYRKIKHYQIERNEC